MTSLIAYRKHIDAIHTREITLPSSDGQDRSGQELCTLPDGRTVVVLFDGHKLPKDQHETIWASIEVLPAPLPDDLKIAIRDASPHVRLINTQMQEKIRARYSAEDEMKFSRIGTGQALGMYKMTEAEKLALVEFGTYLEECRQWAKNERSKLGV
jgi:hypothetical protein